MGTGERERGEERERRKTKGPERKKQRLEKARKGGLKARQRARRENGFQKYSR